MQWFTIICLVQVAITGAPVQKLHFEVAQDEVQTLSHEWKIKPALFRKAACDHVQELAELPMDRF